MELTEEILRDAGLKYYKFYYPYPDYKFPSEILTEESIGYIGRHYINVYDKRCNLFDEEAVYETLKKEKIAALFSNSFLVEASLEKEEENKEIFYVKLSVDRKKEFRIATVLVKDGKEKWAYKRPLTPEAKRHLERMRKSASEISLKHMSCLSGDWSGGDLKYPFVEGNTAKNIINAMVASSSKEEIVRFIADVFDKCLPPARCVEYQGKEFERVFGNRRLSVGQLCVKPANIDLIFDNIFLNEQDYTVIDNEWVCDFYVPVKFIIHRVLTDLYYQEKQLEEIVSKKELFRYFNITEDEEEIYHEWALYFVNVFLGGDCLSQYVKYMPEANLQQLIDKGSVISSLYLDYGEGYSEENKLNQSAQIIHGSFEVNFEVPEGVKRLRWDPEENRPCICRVKIFADGCEVPWRTDEEYRSTENGVIFLSGDPKYFINLYGKETHKICVKGVIRYYDSQEIADILEEDMQEKLQHYRWSVEEQKKFAEEMRNKVQALEEQIRVQERKRIEAETTLEWVFQSKGWRILDKCRKIKAFFIRQ